MVMVTVLTVPPITTTMQPPSLGDPLRGLLRRPVEWLPGPPPNFLATLGRHVRQSSQAASVFIEMQWIHCTPPE